MDKVRQKPKKDQPIKYVGKDKNSTFITDLKSMKEHIKIKEILRNVKMNSSMRLKAPKGSKIMQNKDFTDDFDEGVNSDEISASATNVEIVKSVNTDFNDRCESDTEAQNSENAEVIKNRDSTSDINESSNEVPEITDQENSESDKCPPEDSLPDVKSLLESSSRSETEIALTDNKASSSSHEDLKRTLSIESSAFNERINNIQTRERKLSLDQTMLNRRASFSQSELDLHSIGKSPLERKSSFFRKKLENFFKNTTEVFKRQSLGSKTELQRRSSMSMSLQSLNEDCTNHNSPTASERLQQSNCSLQSSSTVGCSNTSLQSQGDHSSQTQGDPDCLASSQPVLCTSQPLTNLSTESIDSLTEAYIQETMLNSRAISMSSGLDSANGTGRRKASRSNRVTWLASEGWTNYLRRVIQDEKNRQIQVCHSYQDLSSIPENYHGLDSKGRRLSYQRAVSGEDPMPPPRYQDTSLRKRGIPENSEANFELSNQLAEFTRSGVPSLKGFCVANVPDEALAYLLWAEHPLNIEEVFDWKKLTPNEEARQAVIRELISTEADYIRHLISIVEVFIAAAHALQDSGKLLDVDTERLFSNIPDVLNASLCFWEITIYPMLADALLKNTPFNTELMSAGFCRFRDLFQPYEKYVKEQTKALDYLRSLSSNTDFMTYLTWCHGHKSCNRLQLSDIMVKPMQRLTKYSLILRRVIAHTDTEPERTNLIVMESFAKNYVLDLNRSIRQREELERLEALSNSIEVYDLDLKDEEMERYFRMFCQLNLRAPMVNCLPTHSRTLIHQGDLRFRDNVKEAREVD